MHCSYFFYGNFQLRMSLDRVPGEYKIRPYG